MFHDAFFGKRVLVTGHTGFKGSWLSAWLISLGAKVFGYAIEPQEHEVLYGQLQLASKLDHEVHGDIRDGDLLSREVARYEPDFVFHLAAQPLVRASYQRPRETIETNVMGTVNVLESLMDYPKPCSVVVVTTDKCYENKEWLHSYREEDPLGGYDPYSASKGCAELVAAAYRRSFFSGENSRVRLSTARAGNVIGGGDWAIDRIVPDVIRSVFSGKAVIVRNRQSTRPWQHVLEPLSGYLWLAAHLSEPRLSEYPGASICSAFNFGPHLESNRTVLQLVERLLEHTSGTWDDAANAGQLHEASKLNLSIDKAFHILRWKPTWGFDTCVEHTASWYTSVRDGLDPNTATVVCIEQYIRDAIGLGQPWAIASAKPSR
ncbi:MAG: CDP-glucose 4,6-dehydratase [Pirellula sp.]